MKNLPPAPKMLWLRKWDKHGALFWPLIDNNTKRNRRYQAMHLRQRHGNREEIMRRGRGKARDEKESLGCNERSPVWQREVNEKRQCKVVKGEGVRRSRTMEMKENERGKKRWPVWREAASERAERGLLSSAALSPPGQTPGLCHMSLALQRFGRRFWHDNMGYANKPRAHMPRLQGQLRREKQKLKQRTGAEEWEEDDTKGTEWGKWKLQWL